MRCKEQQMIIWQILRDAFILPEFYYENLLFWYNLLFIGKWPQESFILKIKLIQFTLQSI